MTHYLDIKTTNYLARRQGIAELCGKGSIRLVRRDGSIILVFVGCPVDGVSVLPKKEMIREK